MKRIGGQTERCPGTLQVAVGELTRCPVCGAAAPLFIYPPEQGQSIFRCREHKRRVS